jgi:hypothetical protein
MVLNRSIVLFLVLLAPLLTWGFSADRRESYKQIALQHKLATNPTWLRLNHYHANFLGHYSSYLKGNFFISPQGVKDPEAELLATIDGLFSENEKHLQCRYLGRMRWLKTVLPINADDIVKCTERDEWRAKLDAREAYVIFASNDLNNPSSSFGHTFLRLHKPGNNELLDYGVNWAAMTGDDKAALFALKGLTGFYPGSYSMLPYHQKIREYTNMEGRDIWEYKLKLSEDDVAMIVDHLLELDGSYSDYYFLDENCSYQILELLNLVRPEIDLTASFHDAVIPIDTLKVLNDKGFLEDEKLRSSLQAEWRTRYAGLNLDQKKELRDAVKMPRTFKFTEKLSNREKAETLEATMSYIAVQDYRAQRDSKDEKYALAIQRAQLGLITDPVKIKIPTSPLTSQNSMGAYLGYGKEDQQDYYTFKFRRTFHDLVADDRGMSPFFHLEALGIEFRYFTENKNLDLQQLTLLKAISTAPITLMDYPLSWTIDLGTYPKLAPYWDVGVGTSVDLTATMATRYTAFIQIENRSENDRYAGYFGPRNLLMTKWSESFRSVIDVSYLYDVQHGGFIWDNEFAVSLSKNQNEIRFEYLNRKDVPDLKVSLIHYF